LAELEEVIVELSLFDIHDVVGDSHEVFNSLVELGVDLHDSSSHGLALGVTDFDLLQLVELLNCASQVHDVLAAFTESIKADKQSVGRDFPLVLRLSFVLKVGIFEF